MAVCLVADNIEGESASAPIKTTKDTLTQAKFQPNWQLKFNWGLEPPPNKVFQIMW